MNIDSTLKIGVVIVLIVFFVIYVVGVYNRLVNLTESAKAKQANIDVLLKQRHSEIRKLVETCGRFLAHEKATFDMLARARNDAQIAEASGDIKAIGQKESELTRGVSRLMALAESYPELKSDQIFVGLQMRIAALEEVISDRKEMYNESVTFLNTAVAQFPSNLIAGFFGFERMSLLIIEEEFKRDVDLSDMLWKS